MSVTKVAIEMTYRFGMENAWAQIGEIAT
jgi:hypothetical protein